MSADEQRPEWVRTLEQLEGPERVKNGIGYKMFSHGEMLSRTDTQAVSIDAFTGRDATQVQQPRHDGSAEDITDQYGSGELIEQVNGILGDALEEAFGDRQTLLVDEDLYDEIEDRLPTQEYELEETGETAELTAYDVRGRGEPESLEVLVTFEDDELLYSQSLQPATEDNMEALEEAAYDSGADISNILGAVENELAQHNVVVPYSAAGKEESPERSGVSLFTGVTGAFKDEVAATDVPYTVEETEDGYHVTADLQAYDGVDVLAEDDQLEFHTDTGVAATVEADGLEPGTEYAVTENNGVYEVDVEV